MVIDQDECIGCEACVELNPSVFFFDGVEEKASVNEDADGGDERGDEAMASYPAECTAKE